MIFLECKFVECEYLLLIQLCCIDFQFLAYFFSDFEFMLVENLFGSNANPVGHRLQLDYHCCINILYFFFDDLKVILMVQIYQHSLSIVFFWAFFNIVDLKMILVIILLQCLFYFIQDFFFQTFLAKDVGGILEMMIFLRKHFFIGVIAKKWQSKIRNLTI